MTGAPDDPVAALLATHCAALVRAGRLRLAGPQQRRGITVHVVEAAALTAEGTLHHGELDMWLVPTAAPVEQGVDVRAALRRLTGDAPAWTDRAGTVAAFAAHLGRLEAEAADPVRWEALRRAVRA